MEAEINEYTGKDPLELWFKYISWIEQSFVKSASDGGILEVVARCIKKFEEESRYKQDRRLIKLYIKYVRKLNFSALSCNGLLLCSFLD
jgi:checkpoint serine/threonine-protein kinase